MVGWVGTGMEVVVGMHAGHSQEGWSHIGRYRSAFRVRNLPICDQPSWLWSGGRKEDVYLHIDFKNID